MTSAARVGDPIEHSEALNGLLLGLAVGAAAVVVAAAVGVSIVASGGLAAVAVVGAVVSLSAGVGELIGSLSYCTNTAGHISKGSSNVFINGRPAARAHLDTAECDKHGQVPQVIAEGSSTVYINGQPAARVGDRTICDGKISAGSDNVYIGGETEQTDDINPEVPGWLHGVVLGIGFGSAVVLTSWATAIVGLIGGAVGGYGGGVIGGRRYGEGSDEQKVMAFGGAFIGGSLAGKGQQWFDSRYEFKTQGLGSLFGNIKVIPKQREPSFTGVLRGKEYELPGVWTENMAYTKRAPADARLLRNEFDSRIRGSFLKSISDTPENISALKNSGLSDAEIGNIKTGKLPNEDWQVHHIKPLDDGGTNSFENLVLIKNEPYHKVLTNFQNSFTRTLTPGESKIVDWPMINGNIYPPPKP
ncbi:PAAR domain-containing protein [Pseudomonas syringae]|uniref:Uncharacterized conserved protein RhaS n=2 Tax=Pseudomonas syringae group TaxID=136849 RepID=A0A2G9L9Y0_PSESF|nr:PAAR domain-containing protein [Pseudomonas syringae]MDU8429819.1 PAAR domain-containing protein [Pseudomonas syringae pv. actinidifoliorum]OZI86276.1 hypothetical protein CFN58_13320 [Pseudomonas avellanae]AQL39846.1 hypothetical protein JN853_27740 [Pseudomonas syringae pv. actinidiae ICMP 9853]ATV16130.1 hypothetical protein CT122_03800 [Pseudomonas syringae pv. actinidiae]EGH64041.1 PAAR repeat-containing protein [Pseudomonas syringae pv. actinidiae str. M302091]